MHSISEHYFKSNGWYNLLQMERLTRCNKGIGARTWQGTNVNSMLMGLRNRVDMEIILCCESMVALKHGCLDPRGYLSLHSFKPPHGNDVASPVNWSHFQPINRTSTLTLLPNLFLAFQPPVLPFHLWSWPPPQFLSLLLWSLISTDQIPESSPEPFSKVPKPDQEWLNLSCKHHNEKEWSFETLGLPPVD